MIIKMTGGRYYMDTGTGMGTGNAFGKTKKKKSRRQE